ncbi:efflux RND transporter periplasmic adaptor subunit [Halomonas sp. TRM85114]|nr:efflux RND transporter periplasmic adaptor subunit [Halomonas jincaotanensis]
MAAGVNIEVLAQQTRVATAEVEEATIVEFLDVSGSVTALRTARLSSEVEGRIADFPVAIGERVNADQTLLTLDAEEARFEARGAAADVDQASAELDDARRRLNEARQLRQSRSIADSELNQRANAVAVAEAVLKRQTATRDRWASRIDRHRLTAPFAGMVTARHVEVGEWASPGTALMTLVDLDSLMLDFAVPLAWYNRVETAALEVQIPGETEQWQEARVVARVPQNDESARQFLLRAELAKSHALLPGMAVQGRLRVPSTEGPVVPRDALLRRPDGQVSVWLAQEEDGEWRARQRRVEIGASHDGQTAVLEGLTAGERIVVEGNERLEDGQRLALSDS